MNKPKNFLELCYQFWEGSWQDDAIQKTKRIVFLLIQAKCMLLIIKVNFIKAKGFSKLHHRFSAHLCYSKQGHLQRFRLCHTTCRSHVYWWGKHRKAQQQVSKIRQLALEQGRYAEDIKIFVGITVVTAETDALAQEKFAEYRRYASPEAGLAHFSSSVGIDLSQYQEDEAIPYKQTNSIASVNQRFKEKTTIKDLKDQHALGGRYPIFIGSGETVAQQLIDYVDQTGIDGFNLTRTVAPESHEDFIKYVIPQLQQRGRYKTAYQDGSLRHKLAGQGDRLPEHHPVAQFRCRTSAMNKQSA